MWLTPWMKRSAVGSPFRPSERPFSGAPADATDNPTSRAVLNHAGQVVTEGDPGSPVENQDLALQNEPAPLGDAVAPVMNRPPEVLVVNDVDVVPTELAMASNAVAAFSVRAPLELSASQPSDGMIHVTWRTRRDS